MSDSLFLRHGETEWNKEAKIQGQADIPLNEKGICETEAAGQYLANIDFDVCYSSPLCRAKKTAEIVLQERCIKIVCDDLLKEISYGVNEGQPLKMINLNKELPLHQYFAHSEKYIPPKDGETIEQLLERCKRFLEWKRTEKLKTIMKKCEEKLIGDKPQVVVLKNRNYS